MSQKKIAAENWQRNERKEKYEKNCSKHRSRSSRSHRTLPYGMGCHVGALRAYHTARAVMLRGFGQACRAKPDENHRFHLPRKGMNVKTVIFLLSAEAVDYNVRYSGADVFLPCGVLHIGYVLTVCGVSELHEHGGRVCILIYYVRVLKAV